VRTDKITLTAYPVTSDENDENVLYMGGQQSSASESSYSERYASQYRSTDSTRSPDEDEHRKKPLSAVNEVDDDLLVSNSLLF